MNTNLLVNRLTDVLKEGIHVVDQFGITIQYNRRIEIIENRVAADVVGRNLEGLEKENEMDELLIEVLATGLPKINVVHECVNTYGNSISVNFSFWPITERNVVKGAIKVATDMTELRKLRAENLGLTKDISQMSRIEKSLVRLTDGFRIEDIVGESPQMEAVKSQVVNAAKCDLNVIITGASGTGKEMMAQAIHNGSRRKDKPLVAENCAAIPENLAESVLFGTVKGGFTGAVDRMGLFQLANGGTLVLDEFNSLPMGIQAKLLRVLQDGTFRPVGGLETKQVNVRVIAITNQDPIKLVDEGLLRSDLFYRLGVVTINVPSLKERKGDLALLASYFLEKFGREVDKWPLYLDDEVKEAFERFPWRGNVRELSNVIECAVNMVDSGNVIDLSHLPSYFISEIDAGDDGSALEHENYFSSGAESLSEYMYEVERDIIISALKRNDGNVTKTAGELGLTRQALQHKIHKIKF